MSIETISYIMAVCIFIVLSFYKKGDKLSSFGRNLKQIYCPKCNYKIAMIRKPNSFRQFLYGGYTCKKCNTELDRFGDEIKAGNNQ